jgi:Spy/CpxP family protein refolding chaperone
MKRSMGWAILGAALLALPAWAQTTGTARHQGREGYRQHRGERLADYLGLNEDQRAQWRDMVAKHREEMKPLREEGQKLRERVREAVDANAPDAEVGAAVKALHAYGEKMRAANKAFESQLESVLTEAQKQKYDAFKAARSVRRGGQGEGPGGFAPPSDTPPEDAPLPEN